MAYTEADREYYIKNRDKVLSRQRENYSVGTGKEVKQAYYWANRERILSDKKKYNEGNTEVKREYNRVRYLNNSESMKQERRLYYSKNKDRILDDAKVYYKAHKEEIRAQQNAWAKTEDGRKSDLSRKARRRARKLEAGGTFTADDIKDLYATQGGSCYYCSVDIEQSFHIEHMLPLSRDGRNDISNICLAC
ncbi:hypothetical protein LCGC14_2257190, partial [marine sediment metagenome]